MVIAIYIAITYSIEDCIVCVYITYIVYITHIYNIYTMKSIALTISIIELRVSRKT